jgi:hypothetical protein
MITAQKQAKIILGMRSRMTGLIFVWCEWLKYCASQGELSAGQY